jgi:hypothetical protein
LFDFRFLFPPKAKGPGAAGPGALAAGAKGPGAAGPGAAGPGALAAGASTLAAAAAAGASPKPKNSQNPPPLCDLFFCDFLCDLFLCEGILYNIETKQILSKQYKNFLLNTLNAIFHHC